MLPEALPHEASGWTGWPSVDILWCDRIASLICSFYLSVAGITDISYTVSLILLF